MKPISAPRATALFFTMGLLCGAAQASPGEDRVNVAALDTAYQAAVERNDADAMGAILLDDMILVIGAGGVYSRREFARRCAQSGCDL
jgi:hypothetical protein